MGRTLSKAIALTLAAGAFAAPAALAELPGEFTGNIAYTTDYKYRGITQSGDGPAVSGGFDWAGGDFYVGTWASSVEFGDDTGVEIDYYAGYAPTVGAFDLDFGLLYYTYPDATDEPDEQNFLEFYVGAGTSLAGLDLAASFSYSDDFYGADEEATYLNGSVGYGISDAISVDAGVGFSSFDDGGSDDYTDYSVGATYSCDWADFDLRYIDTDRDGVDDDQIVFTVARSL